MSQSKSLSTYNKPISEIIADRIVAAGCEYQASDNIAQFISDDERTMLIDELTERFDCVIDSLVIDRANDPNSIGTGRRLAKMYVNEIMRGRYFPEPDITAFPNTGTRAYQGMLVVRSEIKSICSHHHQPVRGVCYIGILPGDRVIGLSKYTRIAQHLARRGTLQEELSQRIMHTVMDKAHCRDVAVHISATHGCVENRGVSAHSSLTQTTSLSGQFFKDDVKAEFFNNIKMQMRLNGDHA